MTLRCSPAWSGLTWTCVAIGLSFGSSVAAAADLDTSPLPVKTAQAFPEVQIERPILLTHAGDGTNRVFVPSQLGKIYVFPNKDDVTAEEVKLFCDLEPKVRYFDKENEEGLLGMAFHPKYKENGQFFVYFTEASKPRVSRVSRFTVSKDDPNRADPKSEEILLRIPQPDWNHNGGTIAFGPDGYLYIALGDGGAGNDVYGNSQKPDSLLAKVLRIDVNVKADPKKVDALQYGIPKDNPFVDKPGFRPEIYAWGFRNPWRFSFDRETGALWLADVGQNEWEEIDIVEKGGNYGWSQREGLHPFGNNPKEKSPEFIDPIFEYHHEVGKSITGGHVYRGKLVPELVGKYIYADYVSGKLWALDYDAKAKKVTGNHPIPGYTREGNVLPVLSFGEDEQGEVYFLAAQGDGRITRFVSAK